MNVDELKRVLEFSKIPEHHYNLDENGRDDERLCLKKLEDKWEVYYLERGVKTTDLYFDTEEEACTFFYAKMSRIFPDLMSAKQ